LLEVVGFGGNFRKTVDRHDLIADGPGEKVVSVGASRSIGRSQDVGNSGIKFK